LTFEVPGRTMPDCTHKSNYAKGVEVVDDSPPDLLAVRWRSYAASGRLGIEGPEEAKDTVRTHAAGHLVEARRPVLRLDQT